MIGDILWFYGEVRNNGDWDYKQQGKQYEDFGNFNYGATGAALGLDLTTLLRMAGFASIQASYPDRPWPGDPGGGAAAILAGLGKGIPPYGDDPHDQQEITLGFRYYQLKYAQGKPCP